MFDWKQKLALIAVPAALVVGGLSVTAYAVGPPTMTPPATSQAAEPVGSAEKPETTAAEVNEPSLPGGGHSDAAGQVDHQFEGSE